MAGITLPDAVCWYEGMRLTPQHFQQHATRSDMLGAYLLRAAHPLHWGLLRLAYHLRGSVLEISELEAVMPDGLCVCLERDEAPLGIDLAAHQPEQDGTYRLALAVAQRQEVRQAGPGRFQEVPGVAVLDHNNGGAAVKLTVLRPHLQLVCGRPPGFGADELLPLARWRQHNGAYADSGYIGPWLRVTPDSPLYSRIEQLCLALRGAYDSFARQFAAAKERGQQQQMAESQVMLTLLGSRLLELEALYTGKLAHPQHLHLLLCGLLGALTVVDPAAGCPQLPPFDYRELNACMDPLFGYIEARRQRLAPKVKWLNFAHDQKQGFDISLADIAPAQRYYIGLRQPARATDADMARWINDAVIGSVGLTGSLTHNRASGIRKTALPREQAQQYEADPGLTVFQLDVADEARHYFDPAGTLRIAGPAADSNGHVAPEAIVLLQRQAPGAGHQES